jgi:hypothetical protein
MELTLDPSSIRLEKPHREQRAVKPQLHATGSINDPMRFRCSVACRESKTDCRGRDQLSAIKFALAEALAGAAVTLDTLNARLPLGQEIDLTEHARAIPAIVRVATRLGLRRAKNIALSPDPESGHG